MFGISSGELFFIAIIALIVLGPERLPKATRLAGMWVRRARTQWHSVKDELERELAAEELKRNLHDAQAALRDTEQKIRDSGDEARKEFEQMRASVYTPPAQADVDLGQTDPAHSNLETEMQASKTPGDSTQPTQGDGDEPRSA